MQHYTYRRLYRKIQRVGVEQQHAQIMLSSSDLTKPLELLSLCRCNTLAALGVEDSRGSYDNQHHPQAVVLVGGLNPFTEDGDTIENLKAKKPYLYQDLLSDLESMTPEQKDQLVQVLFTADGGIPALFHFTRFMSLADLEVEASRSSYDNQHHPEDYVVYVDWNMFGEDGSIGFDLITGEKIFPTGPLDSPHPRN